MSIKLILHILPYLLLVGVTLPILGIVSSEGLKYLGYKTVTVEVVGTGSMYPSLFWDQAEGGPEDASRSGIQEYRSSPLMYRHFAGIHLFGKTYLSHQVAYGDMVAFQNEGTRSILEADGKDPQIGFIKRVIGVPGDTIELRDGYVIKNGTLLEEPYIYLPRSTYGGKDLPDCHVLKIPVDSYLVLGDNRKISTDSRSTLGLIKANDILFDLPYAKQEIYHSLWRDPSKDADLLGTPTLDRNTFYTLINRARTKSGRSVLKPVAGLAQSAALRGTHLLSDKSTTYTISSALKDASYSNTVTGEFVSYGRFTAEELLQNLLGYGETSKQIMNKDYQDLGVTATTMDIAGCPTQVIVGHLGGYLPASYDETTISNWRTLRDSLGTAITSWEGVVGYNKLDQTKLFALLDILRRRLKLAEEVSAVMEQKGWLSNDQSTRIKADAADADAAERLAKELNGAASQ